MWRLCLIFLAVIQASCGGKASSLEPTTEPELASAAHSLSGHIIAAEAMLLDGDIKDSRSRYQANNTPLQAQAITSTAAVQGYASEVDDPADYYQVSLEAGQSIRLDVFDAPAADLDLFLLNAAATQVQASQRDGNAGKLEELSVTGSGEYLIYIRAVQGASKYRLQLQPSSSAQSHSLAARFAVNEAVVQYRHPPAEIQARTVTSATNLPVKISLNNRRVAARTITEQTPLESFNQALYEQVQTLIDIKRLNQDPEVEYAEPNYWRQALSMPSDPNYRQQRWHYEQINLPQAWDISTGSRNDLPVIVAVLDTGVFLAHEDLQGQLVAGFDFISNIASAADGDGIDSNPDDPGDKPSLSASSWHGTHVAGTVAAKANNGKGGRGVSWGAKVMPIRVLGRDGGYSYDIAQAIRYAAGLANDSGTTPTQRADIINMSFGSAGQSASEEQAINAAISAGVTVIAAAGNDGVNTPYYPAGYSQVIAVSATGNTGTHAEYSNYGSFIDIAAPGGSEAADSAIFSTFVNTENQQRSSGYALAIGTSMATPHVAGVLALMKAVNPKLSPADIQQAIQSCDITKKQANCHHDNQLGFGEIDAYQAVQYAQIATENLANTAWLRTDQNQLFFTRSGSSRLTLSNNGRAPAANITFTASQDWLSVSPQPGTLDVGDTAELLISVNTQGLAATNHAATLTVRHDSGSKAADIVLNVQLQLTGISLSMESAPWYLWLEDADCSATSSGGSDCYRREQISQDGSFNLTNIKAGNYILHSGTDIDGNGQLCELGELCNRYPPQGYIQVTTDLSNLKLPLKLKNF